MIKQGKTLFILIFFLLSILSNVFIVNEVDADPKTIYVDDNALPEWYDETHVHTIQEGIFIANNSDTIYVFEGEYIGDITINKPLTIIGEKKETTVIILDILDSVHFIADGITFQGFTIFDGYYGLLAESIADLKISDIIITNTYTAAIFYNCQNINIENNSFTDNHVIAVELNDCQNVNIKNNNIQNNGGGEYERNGIYGIFLGSCANTTIVNNLFLNNGGAGARFYLCQNINIKNNSIQNNIGEGFYMWACHFITISKNVFSDNIAGNVNLNNECSNNTIFHNNFNNLYGLNAFDHGNNTWDNGYPSGGNYWSDYNGSDQYHGPNQDILGSDGFGDSPYNISGGVNHDRYPLMYPYDGENTQPIANANGPYGGYINTQIIFNGSESDDPDGTIISYLWDFGDGNSSPTQNPIHTYTTDGNFTVTLTVTDDEDATDVDTTFALITELPNDTEPPSKVEGLAVTDANDGKLNLAWNAATDNVQVDHYKIYRNNVFLLNRTTTFYQDTGLTNGQSYTYMVSAVDTSGNEGNTSNPVSSSPTASGGGGGGGGEMPPEDPQNKYPIANASAGEPYQGFVHSDILFDGSQSYDPDGNITKWLWVFGDNTNGTGKTVQHSYIKAGTYTVTLTVTDNEGAADTDTTICVITQPNRPPTTPIITGLTNGTKNTIFTYTAVSTDADNDSLQYTFTWGDGNTTTTAFIPNGTIASRTHHWTNPGKYIITLQAFDNQTTSETNELTVLIDVLPIDDVIKGYLIDINNDGTYEFFNNTDTGVITQLSIGSDGSYLIDSNGDNTWDYKIDKDKKISKYPTEDETNKYVENIVIVSVGGIVFLGICYIGLTETGKYKFFVLLLSLGPLFTRIQRNEALNQEVRGNIYDYIVTNPGAHYNSIMKNLDIGNGTLSHHLNMLEKMNMVKSRREGIRYRVFYLSELQFPEAEKYRFTELQEKIIEKIKENEGIAQTKLISELGLTQQTINYNIKKLERNGIIRLELKGGKTYCYYLHDAGKDK